MLIVDEVDDLVVNEKPSLLYNCTDASLTPHYRACYTALLRGEGKPPKLDKAIWDDGLRIKREADAKVKAVHFDRGDRGWAMLEEGPDGTPRLPKVPPTYWIAGWIHSLQPYVSSLQSYGCPRCR